VVRPGHPKLYNIAAHGGFSDALAQGLLDRYGKDPLGFARALVLLPNNRAKSALQEAFVRLSQKGLLLPKMAVIGDLDLDEEAGIALDGLAMNADIPPAIGSFERLLRLSRLIEDEGSKADRPLIPSEAMRLAREFARTLDQLTAEKITLRAFLELDETLLLSQQLQSHWQQSLAFFKIIAQRWQAELKALNLIDAATRRNALFSYIGDYWRESPPDHPVVAAGITTAAPGVAQLLETISYLPRGMVVFPNLDLVMPEEEWDALGPVKTEVVNGPAILAGSEETHPQFHLKLLLDRMNVARAEVMRWSRTGESGAQAQRSRALSHAFAIPSKTGRWRTLPTKERSLSTVRYLEAQNSAQEAQAAAIMVREALEKPAQRIAIITPDRELARRISAHLERWDIVADDTGGQPLRTKAEGIFLLNMTAMIASRFAPSDLLAFLKHPLVAPGDGRLEWLENVRVLDGLLRGPRPPPGLKAMRAHLQSINKRQRAAYQKIENWWHELCTALEPLDRIDADKKDWREILDVLRQSCSSFSNDMIWSGSAGRALADLLTQLGEFSDLGPININRDEYSVYLETLMADITVRPAYGGHPRVAIYGLLEARLQQADVTICCGMNEGSWPQFIDPDPWLAPMVRRHLGLPALERQIGLSAHDLVSAMGSKNVVLTRSKRDSGGPTISSRFLLRLQAMAGDIFREQQDVLNWAKALDRPDRYLSVERPAPGPSAAQRRVDIAVTDVDRLRADPFAFYASKILGLRSMEDLDAEPNPAWRGTIIHDLLEAWGKHDNFDPHKLKDRAESFLNAQDAHPLMRVLWAPRLMSGLQWIADMIVQQNLQGRQAALVEKWGKAEIGGIKLGGRVDRLDRNADGSLCIVDYKTGQPPSKKATAKGFSLQLGLLGAIAERSGFAGVGGAVTGFEYWSLAKKNDQFGYIESPAQGRGNYITPPENMIPQSVAFFEEAVRDWILGERPFTAKLHPEYAPYTEYDQLMRLDEWYGKEGAVPQDKTND